MQQNQTVGDVMSQAWFYVATSISHFSGLDGMEDAGIKNLAFSISF